MSRLAQALANAVWARGLTPEEKSRVERETYARVYPKGGTVFRAGDPSEHWIGVIDGLAKMTIISAEGQATSFVAVGTGAWFGEGTVIRRGPVATTAWCCARASSPSCRARPSWRSLTATSRSRASSSTS